jgi:hypothetical protein
MTTRQLFITFLTIWYGLGVITGTGGWVGGVVFCVAVAMVIDDIDEATEHFPV